MTNKDLKAKILAEIERLKSPVEKRLLRDKEDSWDSDINVKVVLDKLCLFINSIPEEPVSEKKCMFTKDIYTDEDRKVLCENCEEKCEYSKKEELVSEDLAEAIKEYSEKERLRKAYENESRFFSPTDFASGFKAGAQWQKDKTISKAVEWLQRNIDSSMWLMNFKKSMEE